MDFNRTAGSKTSSVWQAVKSLFHVCYDVTHSFIVTVGVVGGGIPEAAGGERRHVPLYGRLVAEEQLASMSAPSDIQVSADARNPRAFCRYRFPIQVNDTRGSLLG